MKENDNMNIAFLTTGINKVKLDLLVSDFEEAKYTLRELKNKYFDNPEVWWLCLLAENQVSSDEELFKLNINLELNPNYKRVKLLSDTFIKDKLQMNNSSIVKTITNENYEDFVFRLNTYKNAYIVKKKNNTIKNAIIPSSYKGLPVNEIDFFGFSECKELKSIVIPSSIVIIGDSSFNYCSNLESIIVDKNNPVYDSRFNCNAIIETKSNELIIGCVNTSIPSGVITIGSEAFSWCDKLKRIKLPDSVKVIKNNAFWGCSNINEIVLPAALEVIESYAFSECNNLQKLYIPRGVKSIGKGIITACSNILSIIVDSENKTYDSSRNCNAIIDTKSNKVIAGCIATSLPNNISIIGTRFLSGNMGVITLSLPNTIVTIEDEAFINCINLEALVIPKSVKYIGKEIVAGCSKTIICCECSSKPSTWDNNWNKYNRPVIWAYTSDKINVSIVEKEGDLLFKYNNDKKSYSVSTNNRFITKINIPDNYKGSPVEVLEEEAFIDCEHLESITLNKNIKTIKNKAFTNCSKLKEINIPKGITFIGDYVFKGCKNLIINCEVSVKPLEWSNLWNIDNCRVEWNYLQKSIISITDEEYTSGILTFVLNEDGRSYTVKQSTMDVYRIIIPSSYKGLPVTRISNYGFCDFENLNTVYIPDTVTTIGDYAFSVCPNLEFVSLPRNLKNIGNSVFCFSFKLKSIVISESVETIGDHIFENTNIVIKCESSRKPYSWHDNWNCGCQVIWNYHDSSDTTNEVLELIKKKNFTKAEEVLESNNKKLNDKYKYWWYKLLIEKKVTNPYDLFEYNQQLDNNMNFINFIVFKNEQFVNDMLCLKNSIENFEFVLDNDKESYVVSLVKYPSQKVITPRRYKGLPVTQLTEFNLGTEHDRKDLKCLIITKNINNIQIYGSTSLEKIIVEEGNPVYDSREDCNAIIETKTNKLILGSVNTTIPQSVRIISANAFNNYLNLKKIFIPKNVELIEMNAFSGCINVERIEIDKNNLVYDSRNNCNAIISKVGKSLILGCKNTVIPFGVNFIEDSAFKYCSTLEQITIPKGVLSINKAAFKNCSKLRSVLIPDSVLRIDESAFEMTKLDSVIIPGSVISLSYHAFAYNTLSLVDIKEGVNKICNGAFSSSRIDKIIIPSSVSIIEKNAFDLIPNSKTEIYCNVREKPLGWDNEWISPRFVDKVIWKK